MLKINMISPSGATFKMVSDITSRDIVAVIAIAAGAKIADWAINHETPINLHLHVADKEAEISIGNGQISLNGKNVLKIDNVAEKA